MKKRIICFLLTIVMLFGLLPGMAFATEEEATEENGQAEVVSPDSFDADKGTLFIGEKQYWLDNGAIICDGEVAFTELNDVQRIALIDGCLYAIVGAEETWTEVLHIGDLTLFSNTADNEKTIYTFLIDSLGVNSAAASGILANIYAESSFNPTCSVLDTNHKTSYGICQWNGGRFSALQNYCATYGLDYTTLDAQLQYLQYELNGSEKSAFNKVKNVENTAEGAYEAGYNWAQYFERCASKYYEGRAVKARDVYWAKYGEVNEVALLGATTSSGWEWPTKVHSVKDPFDYPKYVSSGNTHHGTDFGVSEGSNVYSTCDGEVVGKYNPYPYNTYNGGKGTQTLGVWVVIKGTVDGQPRYFYYGHLKEFKCNVGDKVKAGDVIALSGNNGYSTGAHLHYEVSTGISNTGEGWGGTRQDPRDYLPGTSKKFTIVDPAGLKVDTFYPTPFDFTYKGSKLNLSNSVGEAASSSLWIDPDDKCQVQEVYTNGWCKVKYPSTNSDVVKYVEFSKLFGGSEYKYNSYKAPMRADVYYTASSSSKRTYVGAGDTIWRIRKSGDYTLIVLTGDDGKYKSGRIAAWADSRAIDHDVNNYTITVNQPEMAYTGSELKPKVTVVNKMGTTLTEGKDYSLSYSNNINAGTGTIKITGIGTYAGWTYRDFIISQKTYYLDVNGWLDGVYSGKTTGYGTFDVYINGTLRSNDVDDYYMEWPVGTQYEIKDIRATDGHNYNGVHEGSLSGTTGNNKVAIQLDFSTNTYNFAMNSNGGSGNMNGFTATYDTDFAIPANTFTRDGYAFSGWNVRRDKDNKWYVGGKGWFTESEISANGYGKSLYPDKSKYTFNNYWTDGYAGISSYTFYAVWQQNIQYYTLDLNGWLDGSTSGGLNGFGTADVYINGTLVADDQPDYCQQWPAGTTYEIKDIRANDGYLYLGTVTEGSLSGTLNASTSVRPAFATAADVGTGFYAFIKPATPLYNFSLAAISRHNNSIWSLSDV